MANESRIFGLKSVCVFWSSRFQRAIKQIFPRDISSVCALETASFHGATRAVRGSRRRHNVRDLRTLRRRRRSGSSVDGVPSRARENVTTRLCARNHATTSPLPRPIVLSELSTQNPTRYFVFLKKKIFFFPFFLFRPVLIFRLSFINIILFLFFFVFSFTSFYYAHAQEYTV